MPQPVTFEPGVRYVLQEESYQVIQLLDDGMLVARHLTTNTHIAHRLTELWQHWQEHTLEFAREGANLRENTGTLLKTTYAFADLADLPPNLQEITWHRYQLIRPLLHLSPHQRTRQRVEEQIQTYLSLLEKERAQGKHPFLFGLRVGRGTGSKQQFSPSASVPSKPNQSEQAFLPAPMASQEPCLQSDDSAAGCPDKLGQETPSHTLHPLLDLTPRTVSRWLRRYVESHEDIRSLVPSYHQRGPRHSRMHPRLETLLQQAIKQTYLTDVRAPVTHVITSFQALIIAENTQRSPEEQLPTPGNMTIYRSLQQLDAQDVDRARKGAAQAERDHHQSQQGPLPTRPNQRTEFDFAQLDLLVVDATDHLPIGRPTLAAIRDKYTGYPLGVFISFDPPSYRLVMECMLYAFLPKPHVKALFQTQHEYLAFGIPELLAVDNAIELERDLELACLQLGIELQHLPVRKPWFKGSIERWFRTLNTDLIHVTPGTTFSHFLERGDYDSQKHACITLDLLWELLHQWIVDVYTQEIHSGVGGHPRGKGVPALLWQQALKKHFVPHLPPSRNDLLVLLTRTATRTLHHYGIELEHLLYQSNALAPLRSQLDRAKHYRTAHSDVEEAKTNAIREGRVQIKYHPGDLSRIWVLNPFSDQYIEVEATDKDYTKNLSLWKHHVITRYTREELKRQIDQQALVLAKARLQQRIADEIRSTRKIHARQTMARWWNTQVITWMDDSPHPTTASSTHPSIATSSPILPEEAQEAFSETQTHMTTETATSPGSAADLSAPLPPLQEQTVVLLDSSTTRGSVSLSPLPSLSTDHTHQNKHNRTFSPTKRSAKQPITSPASNLSPSATSIELPHDGTVSTPNLPDQEREDTIPISERQRFFGIATRSTRW